MQPELQSRMTQAIRDAAGQATAVPSAVAGLNPPERLAIHVRNFRSSLTEALAAAFPATRRQTGEGFFAYVAAQFIAAAPPDDPIVALYGGGFADFLAVFPPLVAYPWLPDLARFEWALHSLSDALPPPAPDAPGESGDARVGWSDSARLVGSDWAIDRLLDEDEAALERKPTHLLVHAAADAVVSVTLAPAAFAFLKALQDGRPLSAAIGAALAHDGAFDAAATLRLALRRGCIAAFRPL
ncbi:MAG: putative DNA-binding domain-containing protein [Alphaproteobacteria bacterium]|nr:putative DNA-binding domain-containing protein [Alphaproteobacteria bacterium]